jgi:hypothetical protein
MKYIGFKHQRESKQNSDNSDYFKWARYVSLVPPCDLIITASPFRIQHNGVREKTIRLGIRTTS